jgi:SAM-dependent methyltransferase
MKSSPADADLRTRRLTAEPDDSPVPAEYAELARAFDAFAPNEERWRRRNRSYHRLIEQIARFHVPSGRRVLEIGSGSGDLLAALEPSKGVGVDISPAMVELARARHPELRFELGAGEELDLGERFDAVVLSDLVPYVHDLLALFERVRAHSDQHTRVVINSYSQAWRPLIRLLERVRLKPRKPIRNWVSPQDLANLLELSGFEVVSTARRVLFPVRIPLLTTFLNGIVGNLWPFNHLSLTFWIVARPRPDGSPPTRSSVSVVCPCRNEAGHVAEIVRRLPELGSESELLFVEGGSSDDTRAEIERQIAAHPERNISLHVQTGKGKGDAVRLGFARAKYELLIILDGDLSVDPEDLPKFCQALERGRGELINGSRLVYDLDPGSMRFLNMLGNKLFSFLYRAIVGQHVKDTLCGTKAIHRDDYASIADSRAYFGELDPFGDFDLLFGAARLGLKIVDLPVRYRPRTYGQTNISRFRHGLLLARMTLVAFRRFRFSPDRLQRSADTVRPMPGERSTKAPRPQ